MSSTVDQLICDTAPFCAFGDASASTAATVIDTKPISRSRTSENTAESAQADQREDLIEGDGLRRQRLVVSRAAESLVAPPA